MKKFLLRFDPKQFALVKDAAAPPAERKKAGETCKQLMKEHTGLRGALFFFLSFSASNMNAFPFCLALCLATWLATSPLMRTCFVHFVVILVRTAVSLASAFSARFGSRRCGAFLRSAVGSDQKLAAAAGGSRGELLRRLILGEIILSSRNLVLATPLSAPSARWHCSRAKGRSTSRVGFDLVYFMARREAQGASQKKNFRAILFAVTTR